jgi:hypothetical protein
MKEHTSERANERLFRAIVVMGSSLAVGCGGTTADDERFGATGTGGSDGGPEDDTTGSDSGVTGMNGATSGRPAGSGGRNGVGGSPLRSTGGAMIASGGAPVASGGRINWGPTDGGPIPCPPAQWDCSSQRLTCTEAWVMPAGCACDSSRPTSAADCGSNQTFICRAADTDSDAHAVPFECACVPWQDDCGSACDRGIQPPEGDGYLCEMTAQGSVLCGCAWVYLQ